LGVDLNLNPEVEVAHNAHLGNNDFLQPYLNLEQWDLNANDFIELNDIIQNPIAVEEGPISMVIDYDCKK
jgi:hypothetical protein